MILAEKTLSIYKLPLKFYRLLKQKSQLLLLTTGFEISQTKSATNLV